jgi:hypothetical protein
LMSWLLRVLFSLTAKSLFTVWRESFRLPCDFSFSFLFFQYTLILYHKRTCSLVASAHALENHKMQHTIYRGQS